MKLLEGESAGPSDIERLGDLIGDADHLTVIRRRDIKGLFDTTPDLSGGYLDVSQYIRGIDERNVSVFWRDMQNGEPDDSEPKPRHSETVSVPLGGTGTKGILDYLKDRERRAWRWDFLDDRWAEVRLNEIHPGMTLILDATRGGYSSKIGWDISVKEAVEVIVDSGGELEDGQGLDPGSTSQGRWVKLSCHSRHVEREVDKVLAADWIDDTDIREAVRIAALHHDVGKAHGAFQEMLRKDGECPPEEGILLAKSKGNGKIDRERRHFRHELGSALAVLEHAEGLEGRYRDLAAYLAASHHGKIRLGIRSLPGAAREEQGQQPGRWLSAGIQDSRNRNAAIG